jgi:RNA polymerase sigma factor (sigma-70 family)
LGTLPRWQHLPYQNTGMSDKEFNIAIAGFRPDLMKLALKLTGDYDTAQDLVQDTYLHMHLKRDILIKYTSIKGVAIRILKRKLLNDYSATARQPLIDRTKDIYESDMSCQPETGTWDIARIIATLPDGLKLSFELYVKGYQYQEIADIRNMPVGTIKSHVCRARKRITELLTKNGY